VKILNLSVEDMAGAAYTLSHAINKTSNHSAINIRMANNYINYPTLADAKYYNEESIRKIIDASDVIVFHTAILPYMSAFHLDKTSLKNKKCLLYFHGTDCRHYGKVIIQQAKEALGNFEVLVSTPDLLEYLPEATWMPVCRSFSEIKEKYTLPIKDKTALIALNANPIKTTVGHAPTNTERKGSALFLKIITELIQNDPTVEYQVIQNMSWDSCLSAMSNISVYYDQHIIGAYGLAAVEASIFKAAVFCKLSTQVLDTLKSETKIANPFIQWETEDDIRERSFALVHDAKIRKRFGTIAYNYCKAVHDEQPVATRFLKLVEGM
jgi:hypothetical protein